MRRRRAGPILLHCRATPRPTRSLDAIEAAYGANAAMGINRIEHATMARPDQLDRVKTLGCEPSFLMTTSASTAPTYRDQLFGPERADFMVPGGRRGQAGIGFSLHTDAPARRPALNPMRLVHPR